MKSLRLSLESRLKVDDLVRNCFDVVMSVCLYVKSIIELEENLPKPPNMEKIMSIPQSVQNRIEME